MIDELMQRLQDANATFTSAEVQELMEYRRTSMVLEAAERASFVVQMIKNDHPWEVSNGQEEA